MKYWSATQPMVSYDNEWCNSNDIFFSIQFSVYVHIVGSSVSLEISLTNLLNTDVVCIPGGKPSEYMNSREVDDNRTASAIIDNYSTMKSVSKTNAEWVMVSSVLTRLKSLQVRNRDNEGNAGPEVICYDEILTFEDNRIFVHLGDGSINEGNFPRDITHLTKQDHQ